MAPTAPTVTCVSEWFIKPSHPPRADDLPQEPIHLTPFELVYLNLNYSQKGLLYSKPPPSQSQTENNNDGFSITAFLDDLRRSLSDTLTHFHPLAGRLATRKQSNPPSYVIYLDPAENSPGIKLVYATSSVTVCDILSPNDVTLFHPFFDLNHAINHDGHTLPLLSVQVTELVDGIFIGGSINHVVADGTSFWRFMNSWSQTYNNNLIIKSNNTSSLNANGNASSQFIRTPIKGCDPMIINLPYTHHHQFIQRIPPPQVAVMERFFHLSSSSISKLKAKANAEAECQKISSLQAVSALVWRCITRARRLPQDAETVCKLATSNRHRLNPPLADDYFGNPVNLVRGTATVADLISKGLGWAALQLNEAIRKHDDTAVKEWIHSWSKSPSIVKLSGIFEQSNTVTIGSSPRFDMYACEFGLGKPVATRSGCANKADGKITLFPGRDGPGSMGVEICLLPQYMMDLESDQDFITTAQI